MTVRDGSRAGASDSCDARVARARRLARKEAAEKEARWQAFRAESRRVFRDVEFDTDSDDGWQEKCIATGSNASMILSSNGGAGEATMEKMGTARERGNGAATTVVRRKVR